MNSGSRDDLERELARLRAENARLLRLLELTPQQARAPAPVQTGLFHEPPGPVHAQSSSQEKVRFFRALFAARRDVYATRWENARTDDELRRALVAEPWLAGLRRDLTEDRTRVPLNAMLRRGRGFPER